jgi:hypothetical protein
MEERIVERIGKFVDSSRESPGANFPSFPFPLFFHLFLLLPQIPFLIPGKFMNLFPPIPRRSFPLPLATVLCILFNADSSTLCEFAHFCEGIKGHPTIRAVHPNLIYQLGALKRIFHFIGFKRWRKGDGRMPKGKELEERIGHALGHIASNALSSEHWEGRWLPIYSAGIVLPFQPTSFFGFQCTNEGMNRTE